MCKNIIKILYKYYKNIIKKLINIFLIIILSLLK